MKRTLKILSGMLAALVAILAVQGCSTGGAGDPKIESQIAGSWKAVYTMTEFEDGEYVKMKMTERINYNADTHRFKTEVNVRFTAPVNLNLCTLTAEGTWSADATSLTENYDRSSVDFDFHTGLLDREDREEFKREMMSEFESKSVGEIRELTPERLVVYDGEDEIVYKRTDTNLNF